MLPSLLILTVAQLQKEIKQKNVIYYMYMSIILQAVAPIFLLILLGIVVEVLLRDKIEPPKYLVWLGCAENSWISGLNGFALYIGLPALIFYSLSHTDKSQILSSQIIGLNALILIATIFIVTVIVHTLRLKKDVANAYISAIFFGQVAYLGFPFIESLVQGSTSIVSMHVALHVGIAFTVLLLVLEYQKSGRPNTFLILKNLFKNPLLLSVLLGIIWLVYALPINPIVDKALAMLAGSASPVVLIAIGMFMGRKIHFDKTFNHAVVIAVMKIVALPLAFLFLGRLSGASEVYNISIVLAGMPVALTCFALSEIYDINKKIISNAIVISTLGSVFTLTALSFIVF